MTNRHDGNTHDHAATDAHDGTTDVGTTHTHDAFHQHLHQIVPEALSGLTAQTAGMRRVEAISGRTVGSVGLWMGQTHVAPATGSANHHHGVCETGIFVVSGHPEFVFLDDTLEVPAEKRLVTNPGDYIYVPPWVPHREENPDPYEEAVVVIARTTQEAVVVNLPDLQWVGPIATANVNDGPGPATWHTY